MEFPSRSPHAESVGSAKAYNCSCKSSIALPMRSITPFRPASLAPAVSPAEPCRSREARSLSNPSTPLFAAVVAKLTASRPNAVAAAAVNADSPMRSCAAASCAVISRMPTNLPCASNALTPISASALAPSLDGFVSDSNAERIAVPASEPLIPRLANKPRYVLASCKDTPRVEAIGAVYLMESPSSVKPVALLLAVLVKTSATSDASFAARWKPFNAAI